MNLEAIVSIITLIATFGAALIYYLVRIEKRLTKIETTLELMLTGDC
jgi:hypothetical protein